MTGKITARGHRPSSAPADTPSDAAPRLFVSERPTPCQQLSVNKMDELWFATTPKYHRAEKLCRACPFIGRCGYNAVANRATHGVWGGRMLPGNRQAHLEPIYIEFLEQFQARSAIELGGAPMPPMPSVQGLRRQRSSESAA